MWIIGEEILMICPHESYKLALIGSKGDWHWEHFEGDPLPTLKVKTYVEEQPMPDNLYSIWTGRKMTVKREIQSLEELVDNAHDTCQADHHYIDVCDLPLAVKTALRHAQVEVETSSYTVGEPSAFIRASVEFPDGTAHFEVSIGSLQPFIEDEDEEMTDEQLQDVASEMAACFEWENDVVHFEADYNYDVKEECV